MWPFTGPGAVWLVLYVLTFALHAVFVSYVLGGTVYALVQAVRKPDDATAERVRDRLPFMLGCGITAGVAPLLFLQLLHQRRFYTANLIAGPRWGAVVPALIVGFYALYLAKASVRFRKIALAVGATCFLFVAWSWAEIHLLMQDDAAWRDMYAAGKRVYGTASVPPRLLVWLGAMATIFATVSLWWTPEEEPAVRRRLVAIGVAGRVVSAIGCAWLVARGASTDGAAHGWLYIAIAALAVEAAGWAWTWVAPNGAGPLLVTGAGTAALVAAAVVREAPRLALLEPPRQSALDAGGFPLFVVTLLAGAGAIAWIIRVVRTASPDEPPAGE
jgi:hypothetical protein